MSKIAIVTGGTRGIGADIVRGLIADGHTVIATYHGNDEKAQAFKSDVGCDVAKFDVGDFEACATAIKAIEEKFGRIDILVNNAGITRDAVLHKMTFEQWREVIDTNLNSCFNMCRHVIPGMRDREFGRIINISSINGQKGQFGQANYAASKAGVIGFTKSVALENARKGITSNVICPGYIATEMTGAINAAVLDGIIKEIPACRMGTTKEVADTVCFIASDKAGFMNGAVIAVNGGQFMGG